MSFLGLVYHFYSMYVDLFSRLILSVAALGLYFMMHNFVLWTYVIHVKSVVWTLACWVKCANLVLIPLPLYKVSLTLELCLFRIWAKETCVWKFCDFPVLSCWGFFLLNFCKEVHLSPQHSFPTQELLLPGCLPWQFF